MKSKRRSPEAFTYEGGEKGILLIHGFTGSTAELQPMGRYFQRLGYTVHAPLLAGHGTSPEDMAKTRWTDWWQSVQEGYENLKQAGCSSIAAVGLSMGGLFALRVAHQYPVVAAIAMNAPIEVRDKRIRWARYARYVKPYIPRRGRKPDHIESGIIPYDRDPLVCIASLWDLIGTVKKELSYITIPTLVMQSEQDETIEPASADYIYEQIRSNYKEIQRYAKSGHIITLDKEREHVFSDAAAFLDRIWGKEA
ncbi:alpha/beta hydrolase [Aneurinibacillus uraniidurans]|uniref:alpha/beta hydrolase n=1 Tax=Aneurinibacillus uraniidurans TaxID=2966586 RepID=UPI0023492FFD|nr:alpha/beta fold hydrolase [Aneurinibacillus sp. B1]WCN38223.1 alpha/beta fold hydrolase [Aneurinibacillus sp. B1]